MNNKKTGLIVAFLPLLLFISFFSVVKAEGETSDPNFREQYIDYLKQMAPPTALNGGESSKIKSVFPSQRMPFSVFKFDIQNKNKFSFEPTEKITLEGKLKYTFKGKENLNKIKEICLKASEGDEEACKTPEMLSVPEFNDLGIFVQVWRKDEAEGKDKGDFLVDEFYGAEGKNSKENEEIKFPLIWNVPTEIPEGDYYMLFFVNQNKYFDLSGNPLTVFSEASRFDFGVKSKGEKGIEIDKDNIKINDKEYAYRRPAPTVSGENVVVTLPLKNLNTKEERAEVTYELYAWGRTNPEDLMDTKKELKSIPGESAENVSFSFKPNERDSAYDLKITAKTDSSKTIAYVRFVMQDKKRGVFRFLSFLSDKENLKPMFCVRNANWEGKFKGKIRLSLNDKVILEEAGSMEASEENCFALNESFPANNGCQKLKGEILDEAGKISDERTVESRNCKEKISAPAITVEKKDNSWLYIIVASILAIISIGGIIILKSKEKK